MSPPTIPQVSAIKAWASAVRDIKKQELADVENEFKIKLRNASVYDTLQEAERNYRRALDLQKMRNDKKAIRFFRQATDGFTNTMLNAYREIALLKLLEAKKKYYSASKFSDLDAASIFIARAQKLCSDANYAQTTEARTKLYREAIEFCNQASERLYGSNKADAVYRAIIIGMLFFVIATSLLTLFL